MDRDENRSVAAELLVIFRQSFKLIAVGVCVCAWISGKARCYNTYIAIKALINKVDFKKINYFISLACLMFNPLILLKWYNIIGLFPIV